MLKKTALLLFKGFPNCDHNFGTFDDFGVKSDQKVLHNIILMPKCKGQHGGKKGQKIRAGPSPPFLGNARKKTFFCGRCSLTTLSNVRLVALVVLVSARVKQMCQPALPKQSTISHLLQCNVLPRLCKRVKKISLDLVLHWNKLLLSSSIIPE